MSNGVLVTPAPGISPRPRRRARHGVGLSVVVLLLLSATIGLLPSPIPASAALQDNGWTQMTNNNYPRDWPDPSCGWTCDAWDDLGYNWKPVYYANFPSSGVSSALVDEAARSMVNSAPSVYSPGYYPTCSPNCNANVDIVGSTPAYDGALTGNCAVTRLNLSARPPQTHGCCHQNTIQGATITVNQNMLYDASACPQKHVVMHELGHTIGIGHTVRSNQIMYWTMSPGYAPTSRGAGDNHAFQCMYDLVNCTTSL